MLLFYILWGAALFRVLSSPFFRATKVLVFSCCILAGLWLLGGVSTYSGARARYETQKASLQAQRLAVEEKQHTLLELARLHPTSRDIQQALYVLSYQLGDDDTMGDASEALSVIDPNRLEALMQKRVTTK